MIWIRSVLLMVIMGLAPIIASTIGTSWGRAWAGKILGFFSGLVLYKLAVSVIYATTILFLTSENGLEGFVSFLVGVMLMVFAAVCPFALVGLLMPTGAMIASSMGGGGGAVAAGAASVASGAVDVVHRGSVAADSAPSSPSGGGGTGSGSPSGATAAPDAGAVGSSGAVGAVNGAAGGAASGAAEGGAAAGSAAAGVATGGATLAAQAVAEGASQAQQGISDMVETSAEGARA